MSVGEICNREVVVMSRDESVLEAAKLMRERHVGDLVVVDERRGQRLPVGIVTDRDLVLEVLAREIDPLEVTIGDVMSGDVLAATEDEDTVEAMSRMRTRGVRRMPVVNGQGGLEGIITVDDLIDLFAEQMEDLARLINKEQTRERAVRTRP